MRSPRCPVRFAGWKRRSGNRCCIDTTRAVTLTEAGERYYEEVREGHDITSRVGDLADSSLVARRLAPMNHVVAAAPSYLAANGEPRTPEALSDHNCLLYQGEMGRQRWYFQAPAQSRCDPVRGDGQSLQQ